MLSLRDLLDYCDLENEQIEAIAENQKLPPMFAAQEGDRLLSSPEGILKLHGMMVENMQAAIAAGQREHLARLTETFLNFQRNFPLPQDEADFQAAA